MIETPKLTARQQQILDLIQSAIARTGAPPTRAEIAAELGFKSANAAEEHLQALARKGVIELVSGTSRGIRLKSDTLRSIHESRFKQFPLPLQSLAQLALPLIGRVAAGSPILAQEHVDQTYYVESSLFQR
ncbi:MAG: LexA, partial [uncultured Ramlibacter sp.]